MARAPITGEGLLTGSPFSQYQVVEVTFPTSVGQDVTIRHSLSTVDPDDIRYTILRQDRAASVYNDQSSTRKPWTNGYIHLRASVASLKATILLTVLRT
jgi:hypothetical protein